MNRKERRIKQSQDKHKSAICLCGRSYTVEEANTLAIREQNLGKFQDAIDIYNLILAKVPDYAETYINKGAALHALKRFDDALASYDKAIALKPGYAEIYYNRGNTLQTLKRFEDALASYDKAIVLKPNIAEIYNNRGITLQALERFDDALTSYDKAIALKPDYIEIYNNRGNTLEEMKRYGDALENYDKVIALKPDIAETYYNRGKALQALKQYGDALASYDKAIALKPDYAKAYNGQGITLQALERFDDALASYDKAIALKPDYAKAYNNRGNTLHTLKQFDDALTSYDKAITLNLGGAEVYDNRGMTLVNKGDMQEAEKMFLKALALKPDFPNPLFNLMNIRKYQDADHADIRNIQILLGKPGASTHDREYFYFSLGKIYDDCSLYDEAFECYRQANQIRNTNVSYNPDMVARVTNNIIEVFSKEFMAQPFAFAPESQSPLFIVGMPRSGTTLMANILSNHRSIATAGELPTIIEFTSRLPELIGNGIPYPQAIKHITPAIASRLINDYEKRLRRDAGAIVPHIIDKHPINFRHLGFISILFPKSRIIHCTRHPLDICLSNYFQRFALSYDYSFDLQNIAHFYGEYTKIMEHWRKTLPIKMIEISYEDMVMSTEQTARKTLDFLDLEWDERCLAPHTNPCAVETASNWQVRQPIYMQSIERWQHYEKHLTPLKEILQFA